MLIYRLPLIIFTNWQQDCKEFLNSEINNNLSVSNAHNINLIKPARSLCPNCKQQILAKDNIPLISFLLLHGKCRHCRQSISWQYPIIEFLTVLMGILVLVKYGFTPLGLIILFLSFILIIIATIDYNYMIIPDSLSYMGLWLGLLTNITDYKIVPIESAILAAVLSYGLLWTIYWVFKLSTGKEGFGYGDFKLAALFGAWLGLYNILPILIIASITGIIITITNHFVKYVKYNHNILNKPFPFGPYLVFGGWLVLMYPNLFKFLSL
ncbi:MAG: prepilin peptidase [Gammaproteobacteria bacterium]|nr:prepilin peptidase [Gammaproteobacteria bacterium]